LTNLSNSAFGSGATANITVVSGVITSVTINKHGKKYVIGDILTADNSNFGNTGVGLKITVNSIYVSEISYQWYKNTNVIPGETKPNLTISIDNPSEDNNAIYHCVATNTRINDNTSASADSQEGNLNYFKVQSTQPLIYDFYPYIKSSARTALLSVYPGDQVPLSEGKTIGSNGEILWDLEKDGALILKSYFPNGGGSWTITPKGVSPEGDCNIRARLWGAGGGAGGLDTISTTYNDKNMDNSPGGGGDYLEGNMTLLSGVTYSFMIGGGGKKGANNASGTGGGRGGYNGGGDGASAGPKHSSGSGGGGGGRTEIKIGLPNNPNQPVIAVAAGGGGGGGEGLVDSTGQFANANTNANVFNNDGNQFFGYVVPIDVDNILDVERNGGTPVNRTGDGGGNGGGGSGWLGGLPSNSYLGNDTNGFGGSPGLNGYDENLFRVEKNFTNKGKEPTLQAFSAGTSELKSVRQDPKIEEGLFGAQTTNNTFTGWIGISKSKAKQLITFEDIDNRGLLGKLKYSIGKPDQEGYSFGQNKLNLFNDKGSAWSWQWNAADLNLGNFAPVGALAVSQYTGAKEIAARTYVSIGDGGQLGDGNPGLIIVEPYSSSSGSSFGKNRCGTSLTIKEGKQAVLVLDDGVVKSNETYQWYFEKRSYKDVESTSLQSIQSLENVVEFEDRQLDVEGNSIRAIDFVSVSSGKSKIQNSENASLPVPIPGATLPIYTITSCSSSDAGFYYCIVKSNTPKGKVISSKSKDVRIFVCVAPEITLQPVSVENSQSSGTFTIEAVGNGTLSYEWYRNNVKILNATAQSFSTPDDQSYYCMVTNKLNDVSVSKKSDSVKFSRTFSGAGTSVGNVGGGGGGGDAIVLSESPSADGTSIGFYSISAPGVTPLSFSGIGIPP
ncbi:MAG: immunoglobulin domain-containing protein, partial [Chitinophagaceae bacterium]